MHFDSTPRKEIKLTHSRWKLYRTGVGKLSDVFVYKVLLKHNLAHFFMLTMAAFRLQWQTSVVVTEAIWPQT